MHKCEEIKQHTPKPPVGQRRNRKGNKKKLEANRNTPHQNLWDAAKATLRGKFTVIKAC